MLPRFARGKFSPKNQEKYVGTKTPTYRSSWEHSFMRLCDEHPNVYQWASESIKIPYRHPVTGKHTVYVPDFTVMYTDKHGKRHMEVIEIHAKFGHKVDVKSYVNIDCRNTEENCDEAQVKVNTCNV